MQERLIDSLRQERHRSPSGVPGGCERPRGMKVELLLGGLRIPGFLEYHAGDDQVTFTIKHLSRSFEVKRYITAFENTEERSMPR